VAKPYSTLLIGLVWLGMVTGPLSVSSAAVRLTNSAPVNGSIIINWNSRGTLESASQLSGPWITVTNSPPFTNQIAGDMMFFRLNQTVDASTLHKKVLVGYQGWFRAAGDGDNRWDHWNRDWFSTINTNQLTFEMWPDVTDYPDKYPAPGFTHPGGGQAYLFSSQDKSTVDLHFDWMQEYGIDGAVVQRFVTQISPDNVQLWKTNVLKNAQAAAHRTGRTFMIEYDMSGANTNTLFSQLTNDWINLSDTLHLTQDPRYQHHDGKPALIIFGFYPERFAGTDLPKQIIGWFKTNATHSVTLIGSGWWDWRNSATGDWTNVYRSFDGYCPWNTGNYSVDGTNKFATTSYWAQDLAAATNAGMFYLPQVYPGFSWFNLNNGPLNQIPRLGGDFLWKQFKAVADLGIDMCYVGMFDEVDEATAIFKVSNTPPVQGSFVTYEGLPADWYLRLTAEGSKVISGERPNTPTIPISP
jgi:hypothetical protein